MQSYLATRRTHDNCLVITLNDPSGPSNRTTDQFKHEFAELLTELEGAAQEKRPRGLIFTSAKSSFCVGGDVAQIMNYAAAGPAASFADSQAIKALFRRLEMLGLPSVACISGTAVGGGFELALACHARFCRDDAQIGLGFPEVNLGLVPGAGGMLRCVHLLGVDAAIPVLTDGVLLTPQQALQAGLVTGLAAQDANLEDANLEKIACAWITANPTPTQPWDRKGSALPGGALFSSPRRYIGLQTRTVSHIRDGAGRLNARITALGCIAAISASGFVDGGILESRAFARQACSDEARALIGLRMHDRSAQRRSGVTAPTGFADALRAALDVEAATMLAEGIPAARIINAARHMGYADMPSLQKLASPFAPNPPDVDIDGIGERLLQAQLAVALRVLADTSPDAAQDMAPAINLAAVAYGNFPTWTGGPVRFATTTQTGAGLETA